MVSGTFTRGMLAQSEGNFEGTQPTMAIRAQKAVNLATGGNTSNLIT